MVDHGAERCVGPEPSIERSNELAGSGRGSHSCQPMTDEREKAAGFDVKRPIVLSPWLVALGGLALYGATLNHWVTFASLPFASQIAGWDWHPGPLPWRPNLQLPLFSIVTYPLRWLPVTWRPVGLNVFAAVCAATTLAVLARSVHLARPLQNAGETWRENREQQLTERATFLPALFAVLLLGGQRTFWENAISGTGEMLDLGVFALAVLFLLEFRASRRAEWLYGLALVYGLGLADNWALIGFFPCFLTAFFAVIWRERVVAPGLQGEESGGEGEMVLTWLGRVVSHNWGFFSKIIGFGFVGLSLYALVPAMGAAHGDAGFWELLHTKLGEQHFFLTRIQRYYMVVAGMMTLAPLLFAALNLPSGEGDLTRGAGLTRTLMRGAGGLCLAVGVLMFLDIKWSPNPRNMGLGVQPGSPGFLTFYYLGALSVGYFSGHLLHVFGTLRHQTSGSASEMEEVRRLAPGMGEGGDSWDRRRRMTNVASGVVVGLISAAAIVLPLILIWRNLPEVRKNNGAVVAEFAEEMAKSIPKEPCVVLTDDVGSLELALGACQALRLPERHLFIEIPSLAHAEYIKHLAEGSPAFSRGITNLGQLTEWPAGERAGEVIAQLVQHYPVYCLHPAFGDWLERVCMTPHEMGVVLHPNSSNLLDNVSLSTGALTTNQNYWLTLEHGSLNSLIASGKTSADARRVAEYYSQTLDYWGAELQKAGTRRKLPALVEDADGQFIEAVVLNPGNFMARANQQFNAALSGGRPIEPPGAVSNAVSRWDGRWDQALRVCGPADVPALDIQIGRFWALRGSFRQAAGLFQRSLELAPGNLTAELDLANAYVDLGLADAAFTLIADVRKRFPTGEKLDLAGVEALASVAKNDFARADTILTDAHRESPQDDQFTAQMGEIYRLMGYRVLHGTAAAPDQTARGAAAGWFKKALTAYKEHLQFLDSQPIHVQDGDAVSRRVAEMQKLITNN